MPVEYTSQNLSTPPTMEVFHESTEVSDTPNLDSLQASSICLLIFLLFLVLLATAGNALVIAAILTDHRLRKTANYFLVSLAVADALVAVAVMSLAAVNDSLGRWVFGKVLCDIWIASDVMCSTASILNLCAVSLDRYARVRYPLRYPPRATLKRVGFAIAGVWTVSALLSFLPVQLGWHRKAFEASSVVNVTSADNFYTRTVGEWKDGIDLLSDNRNANSVQSDYMSDHSFQENSGRLSLNLPYRTIYSNIQSQTQSSKLFSTLRLDDASKDYDTNNVGNINRYEQRTIAYSLLESIRETSLSPSAGLFSTMESNDGEMCAMDLNPLYAIFSSLISFYAPCTAMLIIHTRMHQYARKHVKNMKKEMEFFKKRPVPNSTFSPAPIRISNNTARAVNYLDFNINSDKPLKRRSDDDDEVEDEEEAKLMTDGYSLRVPDTLSIASSQYSPDVHHKPTDNQDTASTKSSPSRINHPNGIDCNLNRNQRDSAGSNSRLLPQPSPMGSPPSPPESSPRAPRSILRGSSKIFRSSDHKAAVTLGVIMGVFLLCWLPFFIINIVSALCSCFGKDDCVSGTAFAITTWLGYANSTMNPVIYGVLNRQFRHAFMRILRTSSISAFCCRPCDRRDSVISQRRYRHGKLTRTSTVMSGPGVSSRRKSCDTNGNKSEAPSNWKNSYGRRRSTLL